MTGRELLQRLHAEMEKENILDRQVYIGAVSGEAAVGTCDDEAYPDDHVHINVEWD